jgi:gas vesicle protein
MSNKKTMMAILAGAAAGAIAGILLAPDKGSETRKKISSGAGDFTDTVKNSFGEFIDNLRNVYASALNKTEDVEDTAKAKMNTMKGEVRTKVENSLS